MTVNVQQNLSNVIINYGSYFCVFLGLGQS